MKKNNILLPLILALSALPLGAQEKENTVTVDTLSQRIFMLTGKGGNVGIFVGESKAYMIDNQYDYMSDALKKTINGLTNKPIAYLFNTHMHGDHTGGNSNFNSEATTIVAHDNVRKRLKDQIKVELKNNPILPEITFSEDLNLFDGEETIMVFHVHNAHTDGDAMVYFLKDNVLHMGDTYFALRYPFIDLSSGGSVEGYINAHKKALLLIDETTQIIPGHGRPSNKKELEAYVLMLENLKTKVIREIKKGKSLEEVKNNNELTSDYDAVHGGGFIKPEVIRETFYRSLSKK
ncbi:MBL fold metallo-hydrolase [Sediminicola arcticus]|jgi:cyclase|uniref:MBL fold metallo-hydrolase n=1 Tax=Sediminicola arcticus TaxID=1574308 RepID=A0ABV2SPG1_9FLAO